MNIHGPDEDDDEEVEHEPEEQWEFADCEFCGEPCGDWQLNEDGACPMCR